jgi:SAM-dependent methyltransferase
MRTREDLKRHYDVEKALADRLRQAPRQERGRMYGDVYDELFQRVPDHPQLTRKQDEHEKQAAVAERFSLLRRFLSPDTVFLEIGAGDCSLTRKVALEVRRCFALDVSREILENASGLAIEQVLSDGCSIPLPRESVTLAYSYQVMEHIHPDDAREQLANIYGVLRPGGAYLCVTPNRLNGPHDISKYFDSVATGFHLKEYTVRELAELFRIAGFRVVTPYVGLRHRYVPLPLGALGALEALLEALPQGARRRMASSLILRNLLFISIYAVK